MKTQIISNTETVFRADARRDATTHTSHPGDRDANAGGSGTGGFSQRELRDLVLHWMG